MGVDSVLINHSIKEQKNPEHEKVFIKDFVVVSKEEKDEKKPTGEFDGTSSDEKPERTIDRLFHAIESLTSQASSLHINENYNNDGKLKNTNHITRLLTNEFFFYTKNPLTLEQFQKLMNKVTILIKSMPENLHLLLGSFSVLTTDGRVMNVTPHIECGENPIINLIQKSHPSSIDPVYMGRKNIDIKHGDDISQEKININGQDLHFTFDNVIECTAAGGGKFYSCVDVCLDHLYSTALITLINKLYGMDFENKENLQFLPLNGAHSLISNTVNILQSSSISLVTHVDPHYSHINCKMGVHFTNQKPINLGFGTPAYPIITDSVACDFLSKRILSMVNAYNDRILFNHEKNTITKATNYTNLDLKQRQKELEFAIISDDYKSVVHLLKNTNANFIGKDGWTPLTRAVYYGNMDMVHALLKNSTPLINNKDENSRAPLSIAVSCRNHQLVKLLLAQGADYAARNDAGNTPLEIAIASNDIELVKIISRSYNSLDVNFESGWSPLTLAVSHGNEQIIEFLLKSDANPNFINKDKYSPLSMAIRMGNITVLNTLLNSGANPASPDGNQIIPLMRTISANITVGVKSQIFQLLLNHIMDTKIDLKPVFLNGIQHYADINRDTSTINLIRNIQARNNPDIKKLHEVLDILKEHDYSLNRGGILIKNKLYSKTAAELVKQLEDSHNYSLSDSDLKVLVNDMKQKIQGKMVATTGVFFDFGERNESTAKLYSIVFKKLNAFEEILNSKNNYIGNKKI